MLHDHRCVPVVTHSFPTRRSYDLVKPPSQLWESLNMRKMFITLAATSALALGACQSPQADKVEDQAEAQAEAIDDQADAMPEGAAQDAMENKADVVEEKRSEERRVGNASVGTCRSRWSPYHLKKKTKMRC